MEVSLQPDVAPVLIGSQRPLAITGIVFAVFGLLAAICAPALLEAQAAAAQDLPDILAESANRIKDHLAQQEIQVDPERPLSLKAVLMIGGGLIGFLGAALGTASWVRREKCRWAGIAIAAGLTAIAWNYFVVAAVAAVALFLLAWIVSSFQR